MRSGAILAFAVALVAGLAVVLWRGSESESRVAFTLGPGPTPQLPALPPHGRICQEPIEVEADADGVIAWIDSGPRPTPPLTVTTREARGAVLGRRRVPGGHPSHAPLAVALPHLRAGTSAILCIRNDGAYPVRPSGGNDVPRTGSVGPAGVSPDDLTLAFVRRRPRSALDLFPTMLRRAALFRFGWVGAWTYWALAAVLALAVPALCAVALVRAAREPRRDAGDRRDSRV